MNGLGDIKVFVARWIDTVAAAIVGAADVVPHAQERAGGRRGQRHVRDIRRRTRHAVGPAVRARDGGRRTDRLAESRQRRGDAARQSCGTGTEGLALPVPPARTAAARDRVPRRRGAHADRPAHAVERERRRVRLDRACRRRHRPHGGDGRGDRAHAGAAVDRRADRRRRRIRVGLDRDAECGADPGVRPERARRARRVESAPRARRACCSRSGCSRAAR